MVLFEENFFPYNERSLKFLVPAFVLGDLL